MLVNEIVTEGWFSKDKPRLDDAFREAFFLWQSNGKLDEVEWAAKTILASPLSAPYRKPINVQTIYRTVGDINKTAQARNRVAVAYSPKLSGAEYFFRHQASGNKNFHVVQKQFKPEDFLLDFAAMVKGLGLQNKQYEKEHEIWMRPTPYYASYNADELVDRRAWHQKMIGNTPHPTAQAKAVAAQKRAQQDKDLEDLF